MWWKKMNNNFQFRAWHHLAIFLDVLKARTNQRFNVSIQSESCRSRPKVPDRRFSKCGRRTSSFHYLGYKSVRDVNTDFCFLFTKLMASQAVWLLSDSDSSAVVVVEWISSSAEALYVSGAASRLCSAAVWHLKLLKCQTSLEHCSDVLASWSKTCFMRLSNGIHTYLHKLNLSMRYLASHSVCRCSSLLSRCIIWLAGLRLKSNLFFPSSASSVI